MSLITRQTGTEIRHWPVPFGLSRLHLQRGEVGKASELARQLLAMVRQADQPALLVPALWAQGAALFFSGDAAAALEYLEQVTDRYERRRHHQLTVHCAADPGVVCGLFQSWSLWLLGRPDRAQRTMARALSLAAELEHQHTLVWAKVFSSYLHLFRGELSAALAQAENSTALAREQGYPDFFAHGLIAQGSALIAQGRVEPGMSALRRGLRRNACTPRLRTCSTTCLLASARALIRCARRIR